MKSPASALAALLALPILILPLALGAQEDKTAAKPESATAEQSAKSTAPAPQGDSTTQGSIDVSGQHIAYTAIAGTI